MNWVLDRLQEISTWKGIIQAVTAMGIVIDPDLAVQIIAVGTGIVGIINIVRKQHK